MRHSHLPLAAGKTEADSGQRDDPDLGALQRCGMRRTQLLCVLPPAAHSGSTAQCAAGKTGFPDLEEAVEKAQPIIKAGDGPECGSAVHRECPAGKDEVQPEEHKEFFVPGRYATMFRTVFAVMGKEYK